MKIITKEKEANDYGEGEGFELEIVTEEGKKSFSAGGGDPPEFYIVQAFTKEQVDLILAILEDYLEDLRDANQTNDGWLDPKETNDFMKIMRAFSRSEKLNFQKKD